MVPHHLLKHKKTIGILLIGVVIGLVIATITYGVTSSNTFTISQGVYPGAPSFTIWKEDSTYYAKNSFGVIQSFYSTNASYVINNALDLANGQGPVYLIPTFYDLTGSIVINKNGSRLIGSGSGREQKFFTNTPQPLERLTIGTVLRVITSDIDAIRVEGFVSGVQIKHLAIDFLVASTGNGIYGIRETDGLGMNEYDIEDIYVNDNDEDSYAIHTQNAVVGTVSSVTCYGGGLLYIECLSTTDHPDYDCDFNCGNTIYQEVSGWICKNITVPAFVMNTTSGDGVTGLCIFDRLFIITNRVDLGTLGVNAMYIVQAHHSQFNMLNIECAYGALGDVVMIANSHDLDFFSPYVMYSAYANWMAWSDSDGIRVFGGTVDVTVADMNPENYWHGVQIHEVAGTNEANMINCLVFEPWDAWMPTNNGGIEIGTSALTVTHGLVWTPQWVHVTPEGDDPGDFWVAWVNNQTFQILWDGGGTRTWYWTAGTFQWFD